MKAIIRSGFLALAIMALAVPANAGPLEEGVAAYQRGDYAAAMKFWRPLAEQGHAKAQAGLGFMYRNSNGVPQDYVEAVKWYRMAADQGDEFAQYDLGVMHSKGQGVPRDFLTAHMWLSLAAAQGNKVAQEGREIMAKLLTPDELAEAQRMAREWMAKHQQ